MPAVYDMTNPRTSELGNAHPFRDWLMVLASPELFRMLTRQPSREHLLFLCDAYMPLARSRRELVKEQGYISSADESVVLERAERMRSLLEGWSPNELTTEIVEAARALLQADRYYTIVDWNCKPTLDPGQTLDDLLIWPSSVWRPQ